MNKYEKEARVYPAIAGMIIPIILTTLYVTSFIPKIRKQSQWQSQLQ